MTTDRQQQQEEVPIDTSRFFANPYHDDDAGMQLFTTEECLHIVRKLFQKCQDYYTAQNRLSSYGSLYNGSLGALVFLPWKLARLHRALAATATSSDKQHHVHQSQELAAHAQQHVEWALVNVSSHRRVTLLESPWVGAKALQIALWHDNNQQAKALDEAKRFVSKVAASCRKLAAAECEVLYGRAGALQAILFLRLILEYGDLGRDAALELADSIVQQGRQFAAAQQHATHGLPLLWTWHDTLYLGAAHGVVGILHTLLCLQETELQILDDKYKIHQAVKETIHKLEEHYCWPSGNLDSSIKASHHVDRLVHWCHGATGHILLLRKAHQVYGDEHYQQLAQTLADSVVWKRGLLRKGVGLCHGISGSAYAILATGNNNNDDQTKKRAHAMARFAWQHLNRLEHVPDQPYCLYNGVPALCTFFMDLLLLQQDENSNVRFPLYDYD